MVREKPPIVVELDGKDGRFLLVRGDTVEQIRDAVKEHREYEPEIVVDLFDVKVKWIRTTPCHCNPDEYRHNVHYEPVAGLAGNPMRGAFRGAFLEYHRSE